MDEPTTLSRPTLVALDATGQINGSDAGQCEDGCEHTWCEHSGDGHTDHMGMLRMVSASADRDGFVPEPSCGGYRVPSVSAQLDQNGANDHDPVSVAINVYTPGSSTARERDVAVYLTLSEAQSLRDHLTELLKAVER